MSTLEALERAIALSHKLKAVVRTMKVLAAASIRQYEQAVAAVADYGRTVELGLIAVLRHAELSRPSPKGEGRAAIVFGSDHGLCGRFNETVAEFAAQRLKGHGATRLLAVGARIDPALQAHGLRVEECFFVPGSVAGITVTVREMLAKIESWQREGVETVDLFYLCCGGPVAQRLLPVPLERFYRLKRRPWPGRSLPAFRLEAGALLAQLVRQYLFISLYRACAEAQAAEHSQRLVSMQLAEKNLSERLEELTRAHHQLRQEQITAELLEVVSGFEAVRHRD
ncbi:F0F1 ATP synthase subunit gamma [Methylothermus subterraneus]